MNELRWNLGYGYLRLRMPEADTMHIMVLTRNCGCGFTYRRGDPIIWANTLKGQEACKKLLQKHGYCDPKQL